MREEWDTVYTELVEAGSGDPAGEAQWILARRHGLSEQECALLLDQVLQRTYSISAERTTARVASQSMSTASSRDNTRVELRQIAVQELWKAIEAGDPEAVTRWAAVYVALLEGKQVAMWDMATGEREI